MDWLCAQRSITLPSSLVHDKSNVIYILLNLFVLEILCSYHWPLAGSPAFAIGDTALTLEASSRSCLGEAHVTGPNITSHAILWAATGRGMAQITVSHSHRRCCKNLLERANLKNHCTLVLKTEYVHF